MKLFLRLCLFLILVVFNFTLKAQLNITAQSNALALVQKLLGQGVTVSNVTITADPRSTGFFNNISGTNIGLDSGIVLTSGNAKTTPLLVGLDGNNVLQAYTIPGNSGSGAFANLATLAPGDNDLDALIQAQSLTTFDATILEFDFIPTGDSIKFRYVFSSEEYPEFPCTGVNDIFAFFIQGPGYPVKTNIALIPNTTLPVTIDNINDIVGCGLFPQFYLTNQTNTKFTHNGHTQIFTAKALVVPCQSYHLKIAIADVDDAIFDSGVFLEAKSLSSNSVTITNITPVDASGTNYLAEGCVPGIVRIQRQVATTFPQVYNIQYSGVAVNGVDVQLLPSTVTIPANQLFVDLNINAIQDNILEGIEGLTISIFSSCASAIPISTTTLQIRDYEPLLLSPGLHPSVAYICRNSSQLLTATTGYTSYVWNNTPTLNNINIRTPLATPITNTTKYICTATIGTCTAKDSLNLKWKDVSLLSKTDIACANASTGQIKIEAGSPQEWIRPLQFSINGAPYQADSNFINLPKGIYTIRILDAAGCLDSISVTLVDLYSPINFQLQKVNPSCVIGATGSFTVTNITGGNPPFTYSLDAGAYQTSNVIASPTGVHTINIKDASGCVKSKIDSLSFINTITLSKITPAPFCEGLSTPLLIQSNAASFVWTPATGLSNANIINPIASPTVTTKYFVKATLGVCFLIDSITVNVLPAPIPNAGADVFVCFNGSTQLNGSGGVSYLWTPSTFLSDATIKNPLVLNPTINTAYTLNVIDNNGCKSLVPDVTNLTVTPKVRIFAGNDTIVALNLPHQLNVIELSNAGVVSYEWTNPYKLNFSTIYNPRATLDKDYEYYVTGKTINNCEGRDTIKIKVIKGPELYVPSAFTPNGDTKNDVLRPICIGIKTLRYFRVYNRFGEVVFETSSIRKGWNGVFKGKLQNTGTFVWVAEAEDILGRIILRKGTSTLIL
jgi:gliding motility-associated-like protein